MAAVQARGKQELPDHEEIDERESGGGVTVNLDELPEGADKKEKDERSARRGGEERDLEDQEGALDLHEEGESTDEVRARRKLERQQRKEDRSRRDREIASRLETLEKTNADLTTRLAQGAQQGVREKVGQIEEGMNTARRQYEEAKLLKQKAYDEKDGKTAVEADEAMTSARERYQSLGFERDTIIQRVTQEQQEARRPRVSAVLVENARAFMADHKWYDKGGGDRDSAKVLSIDRKMASDGWDPNTAGYWEELRERVADELPHRFEGGGDRDDEREEREERRPARRQTTGGSGREGGDRSSGGGGNTFYLSSARVAALKEAGMWDDPDKRAKMIRTYKARDEKDRREKQGRR